jgi:hypothetical protein
MRVYEVRCEVIALQRAISLVLSVCILCNLFKTLKWYDKITGIKSSWDKMCENRTHTSLHVFDFSR